MSGEEAVYARCSGVCGRGHGSLWRTTDVETRRELRAKRGTLRTIVCVRYIGIEYRPLFLLLFSRLSAASAAKRG